MSSQTDAPLEEASRQVSNGEEDFLDFLIAEPPVTAQQVVTEDAVLPPIPLPQAYSIKSKHLRPSFRDGQMLEYKTRNDTTLLFATALKDCEPFGFYTGQRVRTPRGPAWVVGVNDDNLYFHIDGDSGASKWRNYKLKDFKLKRFELLHTPYVLQANAQIDHRVYEQENPSAHHLFYMVNNPTFSDVVFHLVDDDMGEGEEDADLGDVATHAPRPNMTGNERHPNVMPLSTEYSTLSRYQHQLPISGQRRPPTGASMHPATPQLSPARQAQVWGATLDWGAASCSFTEQRSRDSAHGSQPRTHPRMNTVASSRSVADTSSVWPALSSPSASDVYNDPYSMALGPMGGLSLGHLGVLPERQLPGRPLHTHDLTRWSLSDADARRRHPPCPKSSAERTSPVARPAASVHHGSGPRRFSPIEASPLQATDALKRRYRVFYAHRVLLATNSEFFANMFASSMFESQHRHVQLTGLTGHTLAVIVTWVYTRRADTEAIRAQPEALVHAANMMLLDDLVTHCLHVLRATLTPANVIDTLCIADRLRFPALREACTAFMMEQMEPAAVRTALQQYLRRGGDYDVVTDLVVDVMEDVKKRKRGVEE